MVITEYWKIKAVKTAKVKNYSWQEFVSKISHPAVMVGTTLEKFKKLPEESDDYEEETQRRTKQLGGGAVFGEMVGSGRTKDNFPTRSAIVLDYEGCKEDIYVRVDNALQGFSYCYHTTCKHCPPFDCRLHVIIPFAKPVDKKLYSVVAVEFANAVGLEGLDVTCLRVAQPMLYCVQLRGSEYRYQAQTADFLDVESYLLNKYGTLDVKEITKAANIDWSIYSLPDMVKETKEKVKRVIKVAGNIVTYDFKPTRGAIAGDVKSCFNESISVSQVLDGLKEYERVGDRYKYYLSTSGTAGVWIDPTDTVFYSHHNSDPLGDGRGHSAFDVWVYYSTQDIKRWSDKLQRAHEFAYKKSERYRKLIIGGD